MGKKSNISMIAITILLLVGVGCMVLFMDATDEETTLAQTEIEKIILQSNESILHATVYPENIETLDEKEKAEVNHQYIEELNRYYAKESSAPEMLGNLQEGSLNAGGRNGNGYLDVTVRAGILDFKATSIKIEEETAYIEYSYCGWIVFIQEQSNGKFDLYMPINKNSTSAEMIKEEGQWKILTNNEMDKCMQEELPYYGSYDSYNAAYQAAQKLNPEQENPF